LNRYTSEDGADPFAARGLLSFEISRVLIYPWLMRMQPPPCPRNFAEHLPPAKGKGRRVVVTARRARYRNFRFRSKLGLRTTSVFGRAKQLVVGTVCAAAQEDGRKMGPLSLSLSLFLSLSFSLPSSLPAWFPGGKIDSNSLREYLSRALKS